MASDGFSLPSSISYSVGFYETHAVFGWSILNFPGSITEKLSLYSIITILFLSAMRVIFNRSMKAFERVASASKLMQVLFLNGCNRGNITCCGSLNMINDAFII